MCCTLGLASLLFLCDFSGPFPFSGCFAVIPPALRPRFSPPSLQPFPSLFPAFPCTHSCRRTGLPVPPKAETAAKPPALQTRSAGGAAPVSLPSITPRKTKQHRTHPSHPTSSSSRGRAPRRAIPKVGPPILHPPSSPPTHARSGGGSQPAAATSRPAPPSSQAERRGGREGLGKLNQRAELRRSEAEEPPPHTKLGAAEPGEDLFLVSHTPTKEGGTASLPAVLILTLHAPAVYPTAFPQVPLHSRGPRAALPVPEPRSLGMHILLPTDTQHSGASRTQPSGSHCPLSAQESSWCPHRAAGEGDAGRGAAQKSLHLSFLHFTPSSSPGFGLCPTCGPWVPFGPGG